MTDLVIIGAGPAGLTAALFAARQGLEVLVLNNPEQLSNLAVAHFVENWPGIEKITGMGLLENMKKQVIKLGVKILDEKAVSLTKKDFFTIITEKNKYEAKALILAMGLQQRKANIPGEDKFFGKGVSYCTLCDGPLFKGKNVAVLGGGDSALRGAFALREMGANKIYLIHRRDQLRAERLLQDRLEENKIELNMESVVEEISGSNFVEGIKIKNLSTGISKELDVSGVFIEVGYVPVVELVKDLGLMLDKNGFISTDGANRTNIAGLFSAGDIRKGELKQIVTASADGAIAAMSAYSYVKGYE